MADKNQHDTKTSKKRTINATLSFLHGKDPAQLSGMATKTVSYEELQKFKTLVSFASNVFPQTIRALKLNLVKDAHAVFERLDTKGHLISTSTTSLNNRPGLYLDNLFNSIEKDGPQTCDCEELDCPGRNHSVTLHICIIRRKLEGLCKERNKYLRQGNGLFVVDCLDDKTKELHDQSKLSKPAATKSSNQVKHHAKQLNAATGDVPYSTTPPTLSQTQEPNTRTSQARSALLASATSSLGGQIIVPARPTSRAESLNQVSGGSRVGIALQHEHVSHINQEVHQDNQKDSLRSRSASLRIPHKHAGQEKQNGASSVRHLDVGKSIKARSTLTSSQTSGRPSGNSSISRSTKATLSEASINAATVDIANSSQFRPASHRKPKNNRPILETTKVTREEAKVRSSGTVESRPSRSRTASTAQKLQATARTETGSKAEAKRPSKAVSVSTSDHKLVIDNTTEQNVQAERSEYEKEAAAIREATEYKQELSFERDGIDEVMEAKIISSFYAKIGQQSAVLPPTKADSAEDQVIPSKRKRNSTTHHPDTLNTPTDTATKHKNYTSHIITLRLPHLANATQPQTAATPWVEPPPAPEHLLKRPLPTATGLKYDPEPMSDSEWMNQVVVPKDEREEIQRRQRDERAERRRSHVVG